MLVSTWMRSRWSTDFPVAAGYLVMALGIAVLLGWVLRIDALRSFGPGLVSMNVNTALMFIAAGWALSRNAPSSQDWSYTAAAAFVFAVSALAVAQDAFTFVFGIDTLVASDQTSGAAVPGRQSLTSSFAFVAIGTALLLERSAQAVVPAILFWIMALIIGVVQLMVLASVSGFTNLEPSSLHTAIGVIVIAVAACLPDLQNARFSKQLQTAIDVTNFQIYLLTTLIVLWAAWLRYFLGEVISLELPYITFFSAIVLAALLWGTRAGLFAVALSGLIANMAFTYPEGALSFQMKEVAGLAAFVFTGALMSLLVGQLHRLYTSEAMARNAAEGLVTEGQAQLLQTNQRLSVALTASEAGVYDYEFATGKIVTDDRLHDIWGLRTGARFDYGVWLSSLHPGDKARIDAAVKASQDPAGGGKYKEEYRINRPDGETRWVAADGLVLFTNGKSGRMMGTVRDITASKRDEQRIQAQADRLEHKKKGLQLLSDISTELLASPNPSEVIKTKFGAIAAHIGADVYFYYLYVQEASLLGKPLQLAAAYGLTPEEQDFYQAVDFGEGVCGVSAAERRCVVLTGIQNDCGILAERVKPLGLHSYACYPLIANGVLLGTLSLGSRVLTEFSADDLDFFKAVVNNLAIARDRARSERAARSSERATAVSEDRLRLALAGAGAGVWEAINADPWQVYWSPEYRTLYGFTAEEPASVETWQSRLDAQEAQELIKSVILAMDDPSVTSLRHEFRIYPPGKGERWVEDFMRLWRDESGRVVKFGGINLDITERKRAEVSIRRSEERLRFAQTVGKSGTFELDIKTGVNIWSPELERIYGLEPGTFGGTEADWERLIHEEDRAGAIALVEKTFKTGELVEGEWRVLRPDHQLIWVFGRFQMFYSAKNEPERLTGVNMDITAAKKAQAELLEAQKFVQGLIDVAPTLIYIFNVETQKNEYIGPGIEDMFGYTTDEIFGMGSNLLAELIHPDDMHLIVAHHERLSGLADRQSLDVEYRLRHKDGSYRWVCSRDSIYRRSAAGQPTAICGAAIDISTMKKTEEGLRLAERKFRGTFENTAVGMAHVSLDGHWLEVNEILCRITGYSRNELLMTNFQAITHPDDLELDLNHMRRLLAGEIETYDMDKRYLCKDGTYKWVGLTVAAQRDDAGKPLHLISVIRDVTRRVQAVAELRASEAQVRLLMREVNHRSKNLLTVVQSIARQTARETPPADFAHDFCQRLQGLSASQDLIVNGNWTGVDIRELIQRQLAHLGSALDQRIDLDGERYVLSPSAAQGIGMALHELATNAIKYGALSNDKGRIAVSWKVTGANGSQRFRIAWREHGGPAVQPPVRGGFGKTVIERMAAMAVDGEIDLDFALEGVSWTLDAPGDNVFYDATRVGRLLQ